MTQPAASLHIQALEAFVGKPLFLRRARGVTPTDAAHELARAVGPMLDGLQARLASYKLGGDLSGTLHIAGPADFIAARLADGLAPLMEQGLRIRVHTGNRERIYGLLGDASADLAVTASLPDERAHGYARLLTERFQLVLAPALAASLDKRALAAGLASLPLIAYDEDLPLVRPVWNAMFRLPRLAGGHDHPDLRIIQDLVIAGHGWSVLPTICARLPSRPAAWPPWPRAARSHSAMICTWSGTRARCAIRALSTRATLSCACSIPPEDRPPAPGGPAIARRWTRPEY